MPTSNSLVRFERLDKPLHFNNAVLVDDKTSFKYVQVPATGIVYVCGHKCYVYRHAETGEYRITEPRSGYHVPPGYTGLQHYDLQSYMDDLNHYLKTQKITSEIMESKIQTAIEFQGSKNNPEIPVYLLALIAIW